MKTKKRSSRDYYLALACDRIEKASPPLRRYLAGFYFMEALVFATQSPVVSASLREEWEYHMCKAGYSKPEHFFLPIDTPR